MANEDAKEPTTKAKRASKMVSRGVQDLTTLSFARFGKPFATWDMRERLAMSARVLAAHGHSGAVTGQFTARGPRPGTMWTQRFGLGLEEVSASDFILVDDKLQVLIGTGVPNPANRFHLVVYANRPDIKSLVHTHAKFCSALSMRGEPLAPAHMDSAALFDDCAYLASWPGIPFNFDEGELISSALADKSSILLANHGFVASGRDPEHSAVLAITMERAAELHLMACGGADAADRVQPLRQELGNEARVFLNRPPVVFATWLYFARVALREFPGFSPLLPSGVGAASESLSCAEAEAEALSSQRVRRVALCAAVALVGAAWSRLSSVWRCGDTQLTGVSKPS